MITITNQTSTKSPSNITVLRADLNLYQLVTERGDYSSLPVCSVSCTVHLQLFTNIDIL